MSQKRMHGTFCINERTQHAFVSETYATVPKPIRPARKTAENILRANLTVRPCVEQQSTFKIISRSEQISLGIVSMGY